MRWVRIFNGAGLKNQILRGSGWSSIVANVGIKTDVGAEGMLKVTHVSKARSMYELTAAVSYSLLKGAHDEENSERDFND